MGHLYNYLHFRRIDWATIAIMHLHARCTRLGRPRLPGKDAWVCVLLDALQSKDLMESEWYLVVVIA